MTRSRISVKQRLVVMAVALGLIFAGPASPTALLQPASAQSVDESRAVVERFATTMERIGGSVGADRFVLEALSRELADEDAETIVAVVHEKLVYEPYLGALRGAEGTLASGAGNALDQALVTARLLAGADYETRIATAEIDDPSARDVLATMRVSTQGDEGAVADTTDLEAFLEDVDAGTFIEKLVQSERRIVADIDAAQATLLASVMFEEGGDEQMLAAARAYAWVQYRRGDGAWLDAHPVFAEVPDGVLGLEPDTVHAGTIPDALQHRFRIQAFVERATGDQLEIVPIMDAWERPVASLYGVARTFAIGPDGLAAAGGAADLQALADATDFFFPMIDGDLAPGAQFFDLLGNTLPPAAASSPMADIFSAVGESTSRATSMFGALGSSGPAASADALTAVYLDLTLIAPGGEETTHRRALVDRVGAESRRAGETTILEAMGDVATTGDLAAAHTLMLDPGRYRASYVAERAMATFAGTAAYLDRVLAAIGDGSAPPLASSEVQLAEATLAPLILWDAMSAPDLGPTARAFRPAPGLLMLSQRMDGAEEHVDVVANPRIAVDLAGEAPRLAPEAAVRAGAWETRIEAVPFERDGRPSSPSYQALVGGELVPVTDAAGARSLGLPEATVAAIEEDLARGYAVFAPTSAGSIGAGWWRIDPVTGETLGRGLDGRGNAFLEYLTTFEVSAAITAGFTVYGVHSCTQIEDATVAGCCIVQNVALAGVGVGVGVVAGLTLNAAEKLGRALALFGALDVGANVGASFLPTFCPA